MIQYNRLLYLMIIFTALCYTYTAEAVTYQEDPIGVTLCTFSWYIRKKLTKAIAVIAVMVLGISVLRGTLSWQYAVMLIIGIVIIMKTDEILRYLGTQGVLSIRYVCEGRT